MGLPGLTADHVIMYGRLENTTARRLCRPRLGNFPAQARPTFSHGRHDITHRRAVEVYLQCGNMELCILQNLVFRLFFSGFCIFRFFPFFPPSFFQ